jgi:hypothetical protein
MFRKNPKNANFSPEKQTANDVFYPGAPPSASLRWTRPTFGKPTVDKAHLRQAYGGQG